MDADSHHYSSAAYGLRDAHNGSGAPIVSSSRIDAQAAPLVGDSSCCCTDYTSRRVPCCCEELRETTIPAGDHWTYPQMGRVGKGGSLPRRSSSSSRRCFCCVPERDELQECERREREERYRSMRAERQQLRSALYDDLWSAKGMQSPNLPSHSYRPNTAHLLRYSQGSTYQRAVALEQERRRQELRREIEARKRELSHRGQVRRPFVSDVASSLVVARGASRGQQPRGRTFARVPMVVCGTENLKQHHQRPSGRTATLPQSSSCSCGANVHARRRERDASRQGKTSVAPRAADNGGVHDDTDSAYRRSEGEKHLHFKNGRELTRRVPASPGHCSRGRCCKACSCRLSCWCCCGVPCICCLHSKHCPPCKCCTNRDMAHTADVVPTPAHAAEPKAKAPPATEKKAEEPTPREATEAPPIPASPSPRSHRTVVDHGRKVYITDDVYLSRRCRVIEQLERDGYVRRLSPTTRSPSAPLPEKTPKWETTRSTSAHRVSV